PCPPSVLLRRDGRLKRSLSLERLLSAFTMFLGDLRGTFARKEVVHEGAPMLVEELSGPKSTRTLGLLPDQIVQNRFKVPEEDCFDVADVAMMHDATS